MSIKNVWGGSFDINGATADGGCDNETSGSYQSPSEEVKQGWLLRPKKEAERKEQQYKYVKSLIVKTLLGMAVLGAILTVSVMVGTHFHHHRHAVPKPDNYTIALHKALMFFDAQRSGRLPKNYNVPWRSNSCLKDEPLGGYYDSGSASKNSFSASFSMTMLSWSVIEYGVKYDAVGELNHVKDIIKWGTDYLLKTFNSSSPSIGSIASQVGGEHDQLCWMRPEDIDGDHNYRRQTTLCSNCPALAAEMASALAAASIVFKNNSGYSKKLVRSAEVLFKFATKGQGDKYASGPDPPSTFYNSTGFWDEFVWGGIWLFFATGNSSYLQFVTSPNLIKQDNAFSGGADGGVFSWDKKYAGAQLLLSRIRIFLDVGYPYEAMLRILHNNVEQMMCSYLPNSRVFKQTKGGLIELNYGIPRPLQYVVNTAFLSTLFSDYLRSKQIPGFQCGPEFYLSEALRDFARSQMDYILGKNPRKMSYIVGFGDRFPQHVFHRGSSIPNNRVKYGCKKGRKWRDSQKPNPNTIVGAMVAGPDKWDGFKDIRSNYNYTEPTIAGNAGLVAALVALSGGDPSKLDTNTIFSSVPP